MPAPPIVSRSTSTWLAAFLTVPSALSVPSASVTVLLALSIAKLPSTWKKPKTLSLRLPLACTSSPLAPSKVSASVLLPPVLTDSAVAPLA